MNIEAIASAKSSDTVEIQDFIYETWEGILTPPPKEKVIAGRADLQNPEKYYGERNGKFFLLRNKNQKICATIAVHELQYEGEISGFLRRFFIREGLRNKGLGTQLLEYVEALCREKKWKFLVFGVDETMGRNRPFYLRNGYEIFTENIPQYLLDDNDKWYFRKKIS